MHGTTGTPTRTGILHHEFGHDFTGWTSRRNGVRVFPVVGKFLVAILNRVIDQTGYRFLSIVQMHKSPDLPLHILLITGIFKRTGHHHCLVKL